MIDNTLSGVKKLPGLDEINVPERIKTSPNPQARLASMGSRLGSPTMVARGFNS